MMDVVRIAFVFATFLTAIDVQAHGGHGGEPPADRTPREPKQSAPKQEQSERSSSVGRGGGGERSSGGPGIAGRRRVTAPHGGKLTATAAGWAEVAVDASGGVSVWFLNRDGTVVAPPTAGFATVVGDRPQALALQARGDKLVGQLSTPHAATLVIQADVGGRSTTVRVATTPR